MNLTPEQKSLLERVLNAFETGTVDGDYGMISIYHDGPHDIRQITYGRSQTTEYGKLRKLVQMYVEANGSLSEALRPFAELVGSVSLTDNNDFKALLRRAGRNDPVMRTIQDEFFEKEYFQPAMNWADENGFVLALSGLVIYDSFIHSGGILWLIRQRFPESPPALGGSETAWIEAYVRERHLWLLSHHRSAVRASAYRTSDLQREIQRGNWDLMQTPILANGMEVYPRI
ncbi:MAG: chitosanase [candidate division KSB1 bacterium]|nr:chitosanase [candidate division KSB1 bacterium]MDZ7340476.1 chitosanase [candidate division KSB1 bacterium]